MAEPPAPTWHDPPDVNDAGDRSPHVARNRLHQRRHDAEGVLATWAPARQQAYAALVAALPGDGPRAAVQDLVLANVLPDDVMAALLDLAERPLVDGLPRDRLVTELAREIAEPAAINQHAYATCGVAALQMLLAREHPAAYIRIVADLASPAGKASLPGGGCLDREPGTEVAARRRRGVAGAGRADARAMPARLFQSAAMELANGDMDYDVATDAHVDANGQPLGRGMTQDRLSELLAALLGRQVTSFDLGPAPNDAARHVLVACIAATTAAGRSVPVGLAWHQRDAAGQLHEHHELLVTTVDDATVYFLNPWGRAESMARADFTQRLFAASLVEAARPAAGRMRWALAIVALIAIAAGASGLIFAR